jgi:hypothetical protein
MYTAINTSPAWKKDDKCKPACLLTGDISGSMADAYEYVNGDNIMLAYPPVFLSSNVSHITARCPSRISNV